MRQARFTVKLSAASDETVSVNYATVDGTAVAPSDYTAVSGTLTFAPGQTSKDVLVLIRDGIDNQPAESFTLQLSAPSNATLATSSAGSAVIPAGDEVETVFKGRFNKLYALIKNKDTGYFGPTSGPAAYTVPYHSLEKLIVEAPDWGHESVSETASFFVKLEAWQAILNGDINGYASAWASIEQNYIPSDAEQPWDAYTFATPATYTPDAQSITDTPTAGDATVTVGKDVLFEPLYAAYGTKSVYLMHWLYDVDGVYGFHNADGTKTMVPINNFQRGPAEDGWATITHPSWDDYNNGGNSTYGWQPLYNRCLPLYADAPADATFSSQWNYSVAPDAESRVIACAHSLFTHRPDLKASLANYVTKTTKMADYMQYSFFDKYFKAINGGYGGDGCHYLLSWGAGFGGGMAEDGHKSYWGFRIGNSEIHFGYNGVDVAYACQTGGDFVPKATGSAARYKISLSRQMELIRWLQSPEGPIAGGVTSNYKGIYGTPTDGREAATFYGLYYNYSPSWHNPPSNNWIGYQVWGLERVTNLYTMVAGSSKAGDSDLAFQCETIMDHWFNWAVQYFSVTNGVVQLPTNLSWVENTVKAGTATKPNSEGTYEYLPSQKWDSNGDYTAFWSNASVPNPMLHCAITGLGIDLGIAAGFSQMAVEYCYGKKKLGKLDDVIPNGTWTYRQLFQLAYDMLDALWNNYQDSKGFGVVEPMSSFTRMKDQVFIPTEFGLGHMPNNDVLQHGVTTFASMRSFYKNDAMWPQVQAYLDGGAAPSQKYHRFWANVDVAVAYAMLEQYFPEAADPALSTTA